MELYIHKLRRFHAVQRNSITLIFYFTFHTPDILLSTVLRVRVCFVMLVTDILTVLSKLLSWLRNHVLWIQNFRSLIHKTPQLEISRVMFAARLKASKSGHKYQHVQKTFSFRPRLVCEAEVKNARRYTSILTRRLHNLTYLIQAQGSFPYRLPRQFTKRSLTFSL